MQLVLFVAKEEKQVGLLQAHWSEFVASLTLMLKAKEKEMLLILRVMMKESAANLHLLPKEKKMEIRSLLLHHHHLVLCRRRPRLLLLLLRRRRRRDHHLGCSRRQRGLVLGKQMTSAQAVLAGLRCGSHARN